MITRTIYIDESGNSGPNYLDKNEGYFILAGWLDVNNMFDLHKDKISNMFGSDEGKNKKLLNSVAGRNVMADVLEYMDKIKCKPFVAIANKRFCIAARIVEVLLDPVYNNQVVMSFDDPQNYHNKKVLAYFLYEMLSDEDLQLFSEAYRGKGMTLEQRKNVMIKAIEKIERSLRDNNEMKLAEIIKNSKKDICENLSDEIPDNNDLSEMAARQAPNLWIVTNFLLLLENNGRKYNYKIHLLHDEQKKYDKHISNMLSLQKKNLVHIGDISFTESKENPMIQAADILAGSVNMILKKKNDDWKNDNSFKRILNNIIPIMKDYGNDNSKTYFMEHPDIWADMLSFYEMG